MYEMRRECERWREQHSGTTQEMGKREKSVGAVKDNEI